MDSEDQVSTEGEPHPLRATIPEIERGSSDTHLGSGTGGGGVTGLPDRYEVVRTLGAGSTGRVVEVRDRTFDRVVAAKVLAGIDGQATARFIREARITASLDHPNIVPIYDLEFPPSGSVFFTMRRVTGLSLGDALRQASLGRPPTVIASLNDRITIIRKAGDALARAHSRGVIHQDVKPDNVMLGEHGEVLLVDWGEARLRGESQIPDRQPKAVGTPTYMSPEQARGEYSTEQSDVYGLGATLFQALFHRDPTWDDNDAGFWAKKRAGIIDPLTDRERRLAPAPLRAVVLKALAADPDQRYDSVEAFAGDLAAYQAGLAVAAYQEGRWGRSRRWVVRHRRSLGVTAAFLVTILTAGWMVLGERLQEIATWGMPVQDEQFDGDWRQRWEVLPYFPMSSTDGQGVVYDGKAQNAFLVSRHAIAGSVAVECLVQFPAGMVPDAAGVLWFDGTGDEVDIDWFRLRPGLQFSLAAKFNSVVQINDLPVPNMRQQRPFIAEPGRDYRLRVEIDGTRVTLDVDGQRMLEDTLALPRGPGRFGLYTRHPGVHFRQVRAWVKGLARKIDVLTIGDGFVQEGLPARAAASYRRVAESFPDTDLAEEARWREGLARSLAGQGAAADRAWSALRDPERQDRVMVRRLETQLNDEAWDSAGHFARIYTDRPALRPWLRRLWVARVGSQPVISSGRTEGLMALRDQLFADDPTTAAEACRLLYAEGRYEDVLTHEPEVRRWRGYALLALGRYDEAEHRFGDIPSVALDLRWSRGDYAEVIEDRTQPVWVRAEALIRLDRIDEAAALLGDQPTWRVLMAQGRAEEALKRPDCVDEARQSAWWALGRLDRALEGNDRPSMQNRLPMALLASDDPAVVTAHLHASRASAVEMLLYRIRGDRERSTEARRRLEQTPLNFVYDMDWFERVVLPTVLDQLDGDRRTLEQLWAKADGPWRNRWAGQLRPFVGFLLGHVDEAHFLAQPARRDAQVWIHLAKALRAEIEGRPDEAREAYRRWADLPRHRRLLGVHYQPNVMAERYVIWRLAELDRGTRP